MSRLLEGITVLDLTRVLSGPFCGTMLADLGARVIKVENPNGGDDTRKFLPACGEGSSAYFCTYNHSKEGITLNLKAPEGKAMLLELVKKADVLIENYRPGVMKKLGLDYDALKEVNPRLVYGCVSGFGQTGPFSHRAGYDTIGQAAGGLMDRTGWPDSAPTTAGTPVADMAAGLNLAVGVLAGVISASKTGMGEKIDIALTDTVASMMSPLTMLYRAGMLPEGRVGSKDTVSSPFGEFKASDGYVVIATANNKLFASLADAMGMPELKTDPKFIENSLRYINGEELDAIVNSWTERHTAGEIVELLDRAGVPCSRVNSIGDMLEDPQIAGERNMFPYIDQTGYGLFGITAIPQHLSRTEVSPKGPAPVLGQHNAEVYSEFFGLDAEALSDLKARGII